MKAYLFLVAVLLTGLASCTKDAARQPSGYYLDLTVDGQQYSVTDQMMFNGFQYEDQEGCLPTKPYMLSNITQVDHSRLFFDLNLITYENDVDFNGSTTGQKSINFDEDSEELCNLGLYMDLEFSSEPWVFYYISNTHPHQSNITRITRVSETSLYVKYDIEGNFSGQMQADGSSRIVPVSGEYRTFIEVLK